MTTRLPRWFPELPLTLFHRFAMSESAGGLLLILTAVLAFAWANSPWAGTYFHIKQFSLAFHRGGWHLGGSLEFWVNDALMAVFFLAVGLEIKREVLVGELAGLLGELDAHRG